MGQRLVAKLYAHALPVRCVALSRDGSMLLSGSEDSRATLWEVGSGRLKMALAYFPTRLYNY
jgi:WD40 repeat protein